MEELKFDYTLFADDEEGGDDAGGGDDGVALTIDDLRCIVAPEARDSRCPGFVAP